MITDSSCTCEDYKNGNLCKHIIATSMEVIEPHNANTKEGKRKLIEKQKTRNAKNDRGKKEKARRRKKKI